MGVHRGVLKINAEAIVHLLASMDGETIYRVHGMPREVEIVGCRVEHWGTHVIELMLEGDELPDIMEGQAAPWIDLSIEMVSGPGRVTKAGDD